MGINPGTSHSPDAAENPTRAGRGQGIFSARGHPPLSVNIDPARVSRSEWETWQSKQSSAPPTSNVQDFQKNVYGQRPWPSFAFTCSAIGLGLLLGAGPVGNFIAPLGVIAGLVALVRTRDQERRGTAIAAIAIGSVVTVLSLWVMLGSQAV
jgi:hypothetical protein